MRTKVENKTFTTRISESRRRQREGRFWTAIAWRVKNVIEGNVCGSEGQSRLMPRARCFKIKWSEKRLYWAVQGRLLEDKELMGSYLDPTTHIWGYLVENGKSRMRGFSRRPRLPPRAGHGRKGRSDSLSNPKVFQRRVFIGAYRRFPGVLGILFLTTSITLAWPRQDAHARLRTPLLQITTSKKASKPSLPTACP